MSDKIPILCPLCLNIGFGENLMQVCNIVREVWKLTMQAVSAEEKEIYRQYMGELAVKNSPKRLGEILKKEGYLTMLCRVCMAKLSAQAYEKAGRPCIRIGAYVFDKKFYEDNEQYILERMKDAPINHD